MRVGIVGCGAIGTIVAEGLDALPDIDAVLLFDVLPQAAEQAATGRRKARRCGTLDELLGAAELVVEATSVAAAKEVVPRALEAGRDVLLLSVGALADDAVRGRLLTLARSKGRRIYLASGAIAGVDGVAAAAGGALRRVTLVTTKPPQAFAGSPHVAGAGIDLAHLPGPTVLFEGSARDAIARFPANVNVAATLALAGTGVDSTRVRIVADPAAKENRHEIEAEGDFGSFRVEMRNLPSPQHARTSRLAALSAIASVRKIAGTLWPGA